MSGSQDLCCSFRESGEVLQGARMEGRGEEMLEKGGEKERRREARREEKRREWELGEENDEPSPLPHFFLPNIFTS